MHRAGAARWAALADVDPASGAEVADAATAASNTTSTKGVDPMPVSTDAILEDEQGRLALRFERLLEHPPDRVWLRRNRMSCVAGIRRPSSSASRWGEGQLPGTRGQCVRRWPCDGLRSAGLLAYSWGEDHLRWELEPRGAGTRLVLTHTFDDRLKAARDAAGWDLCLDALTSSLSGVEVPRPQGESAIPAGWEELDRPTSNDSGSRPSRPHRPLAKEARHGKWTFPIARARRGSTLSPCSRRSPIPRDHPRRSRCPALRAGARAPAPSRLVRSRRGRLIGGVCSGLGAHFDVDPILFRIAFVGLAIFSGVGIVLYLAILLLVPEEGRAGRRSSFAARPGGASSASSW